MRAAVFRGPGRIGIEEVQVPDVPTSGITISVVKAGICGSDLHSYTTGAFIRPGQIVGHEFVGLVEAVGSAVEGLELGMRVTGFELGSCGECFWCSRGQIGLCPDVFKASTAYGLPGALAEYMSIGHAVVGETVYPIPDHVDDDSAALVEPLSVALSAVARARIEQGQSVVVLGAGLIGNFCVQAARVAGAETVVAVDVSSLRLDAARLHGAEQVINAAIEDTVERCQEYVGVGEYHFGLGAMADVVIDTAGVPSTVTQTFEIVRAGGTIVFAGLSEVPAEFHVSRIVHKQPRIVGSLGGSLGKAIEALASEAISTDDLITDRFELSDIDLAFAAQRDATNQLKVIVTP